MTINRRTVSPISEEGLTPVQREAQSVLWETSSALKAAAPLDTVNQPELAVERVNRS